MKLSFVFLVFGIAFSNVFARKVCNPIICQEHATYDPCGPNPHCYITCGGPRFPPCIIDGCTADCFCDEGYIRNVADNKCIKPEDCTAGFGR